MRTAWMVLLGACGGLTRLVPESDSDDVSIERVEPDHGAPGTTVTLYGNGFQGRVDVYFDGYPARTSTVDATTVTAVAPDATGTVDVTLVSDLGTAVVAGGFHYGSDAGDLFDFGDTGGPSTNAMGEVGGLVEISHVQTACSSCLGTTEIQVMASAAFHDPVSGSWIDVLPPLGGCVTNGAQTPPTDRFLDVGDFVYLTAGSRSLVLRKNATASGPSYETVSTDSEDFLRSALYDVQVPDGGKLGPIDATDVVLTPAGFDAIEPWELLLVHPAAAWSAAISKRNAAVAWSPTGGGTARVTVIVFDGYSGAYLGNVDCWDYDSGYLTVPASKLAAFPAYSLLAVTISRVETTSTVLSNNGSVLEGFASMGVTGTATLVP